MTPRRTAERLYQGTAALGHRMSHGFTGWVHDGKTRRDRALRLASAILVLVAVPLLIGLRPSSGTTVAGTAGLGAAIITAAATAPVLAVALTVATLAAVSPLVMLAAVTVWTVLAYRAAPRTEHAEPELGGEDTPEEPAEAPAIDPLLQLCADLIGTGRGVHLRDVVSAVNKAVPDRTRSAAEVRARLGQLGVPTRAKVRAPEGAAPGARQTSTRGVYRDDLETVTGPLSDLQPNNRHNDVAITATPTVTCDVAAPATPVAGPVAAPATTPDTTQKSA